jgi:thymidylate synthase (FAD)
MEITSPTVKLLAITPNCEKIIEEAGRTCYLSFDRITDTSSDNFIRSAIKRGHESIIEHASATFRIKGASRSFTHQIVRHRLASFSQQSQRYVDESDFSYIIPPMITNNLEAADLYREYINYTSETYTKLRKAGISKEDARFILPNALESEIVFTANFRELRKIFSLRLEKHAQWEMRRVCMDILDIMKSEAPSVFGDFIQNYDECTAVSEFK